MMNILDVTLLAAELVDVFEAVRLGHVLCKVVKLLKECSPMLSLCKIIFASVSLIYGLI